MGNAMELEQHRLGDKMKSISEEEGTAVDDRAGDVASDYLKGRPPPFVIPGAGDELPGRRYHSWLSWPLNHYEPARTCSPDTRVRGAPFLGQRARPMVSFALRTFRAINLQLCGRCSCRLGLTLVAPFVDERGHNGRG